VERRKKEILPFPLVPQQLSLISSLHCLPHLLCKRGTGEEPGSEGSGSEGSGSEGSGSDGTDSEGMGRGAGDFARGD
jgi:hypothetical protein